VEKKSISLSFIWGIRMRLRSEAEKILAEGEKISTEGDKLIAEGTKIRAEGKKLRVDGDIIWEQAILEFQGKDNIKGVHCNIKVEWKSDTHCILETGEELKKIRMAELNPWDYI